MKKNLKIVEKHCLTKSAGAGAKCDHFKLGVRTRVRAHLNLDVRGACDPKNGRNSHLAGIVYLNMFRLNIEGMNSMVPSQY